MTASINADTSAGVIVTSDTSGSLALQSAGTTKFTVDSTGAYGQLVSGTAKAYNWNGLTTNAVLDFTSIPSWVKRITIVFNELSQNTATQTLIAQLGTGSTPTYTTSGYRSTISFVGASVAGASTTTGFGLANAIGAATTYSGAATLTLVSGNTWAISVCAAQTDAAFAFVGGGSITLGAALTALRITTVGGAATFDAGTINILYEG